MTRNNLKIVNIIAPLAIVLMVAACAVKENRSKQPSISFTTETFSRQAAGCGNDSLSCATYEVTYPVFSGLDTSVSRIIQNKINASLSMGNPEARGWSLEKIAEDFISGFASFQEEDPELSTGSWYYKAVVNTEVLTDTLITLSVHDEYYTGGAHGGSGTYFININPKTGKEFTLDHFFRAGYEASLTDEGERAFRKARDLADTTSFIENYFEFPNDQFQLNTNYGFTTEGIVFVYNSYEIAPYAAGPTRILIPYEKIKDWLK